MLLVELETRRDRGELDAAQLDLVRCVRVDEVRLSFALDRRADDRVLFLVDAILRALRLEAAERGLILEIEIERGALRAHEELGDLGLDDGDRQGVDVIDDHAVLREAELAVRTEERSTNEGRDVGEHLRRGDAVDRLAHARADRVREQLHRVVDVEPALAIGGRVAFEVTGEAELDLQLHEVARLDLERVGDAATFDAKEARDDRVVAVLARALRQTKRREQLLVVEQDDLRTDLDAAAVTRRDEARLVVRHDDGDRPRRVDLALSGLVRLAARDPRGSTTRAETRRCTCSSKRGSTRYDVSPRTIFTMPVRRSRT